MKASVIVRSKDEAPRLRLTLMSLAAQTEPCEIVVVDDGSTDATAELLRDWVARDSLVILRNERPLGRSAASNLGAKSASGDVLIFLDGDTLAAPDLVALHLALHRRRPGLIARGETWHLRGVRPFLDPESGAPFPDQVERVAAMSPAEIGRARIEPTCLSGDFAAIHARATPGVYPGGGPRLLFDLEMQALREEPDCPALWAAASGSNQSAPRDAFLEAGGFDPELSLNEHRELALRLSLAGLRLAPTDGARTYHLIHRTGWRDPLLIDDWERRFYDRHPISEVPLLAVLWSSLSSTDIPQAARLRSIPDLYAAARRCDGVSGLEAVRSRHFANHQHASL